MDVATWEPCILCAHDCSCYPAFAAEAAGYELVEVAQRGACPAVEQHSSGDVDAPVGGEAAPIVVVERISHVDIACGAAREAVTGCVNGTPCGGTYYAATVGAGHGNVAAPQSASV